MTASQTIETRPPDTLGDAAAARNAEKDGKTIPERLRDLVLSSAEAVIWDGEHAFAVIRVPDLRSDGAHLHVRCLPVGSKAFRRWATEEARRCRMSPPAREVLATAERAIEAAAEKGGGVQPTPSIRVAGRDSVIYLDLGDDDWTCARVTRDGWDLTDHPLDGPYMYRPPRQAALPKPEPGGKIDRLWDFMNVVNDDEKMLLVAAMLQMLWPRGPYPVLAIFGEQGSAKTTKQEMVKSLVDPSRPNPDKHALTSLRSPPREPRDVTASANGARVIGFDNVSYLNEELSDAICRLSTGADMGGRELYSDFDEAIVAAARPVMLNGIMEVVGRPDLGDRTIKIECVPPARRIEEARLWREFDEARPKLLGALLDLLVLALRHHPDARVPDNVDVRMADFARLGEAACAASGMSPGDFTRAYHANRQSAARDAAELDPITDRLRDLAANSEGGTWGGSVSELHNALQTDDLRGKGWWSSYHALSKHLKSSGASLRAAGVDVRKSDGKKRSPISGKPCVLYEIRVQPSADE